MAIENRYKPGGRHQLSQPARNIAFPEIPILVFQARAMRVGAVLRIFDPRTVLSPRSGIRMLDVQGFLRNPGTNGDVLFRVNPALEKAIGGFGRRKADEPEAEAINGTTDRRTSTKWFRQIGPKNVITALFLKGCCVFDGSR